MKLFDKETPKERLQVFISHSGYCSRRKALEIILNGCVQVNGSVVMEPSTPVDPQKDRVIVDGETIGTKKHEYALLNKPKGYVTTLEDKHARKTVVDLLPPKLRHLYPVGRLDKDTEGLLLLTNDGDAAYRLTHPKFNIDKTYVVCVTGILDPQHKTRLEKGLPIEGRMTAPAKIFAVKNNAGKTEFQMTIHEGRKRQIRLMLAALGYSVVSLTRVAQGPLSLGNLKTGEWRLLDAKEITALEKLKTL